MSVPDVMTNLLAVVDRGQQFVHPNGRGAVVGLGLLIPHRELQQCVDDAAGHRPDLLCNQVADHPVAVLLVEAVRVDLPEGIGILQELRMERE